MTIQARKFISKIDGSAEPFIVQAEDSKRYVVKTGNRFPRIPRNEWASANLLQMLSIPMPSVSPITIDGLLLAPHVQMKWGVSTYNPLHFGSELLEGKTLLAPRESMHVQNTSAFVSMVVFDKWVANLDYRQAVFVEKDGNFKGYMIDNENAFCDLFSDVKDFSQGSVYPSLHIYQGVTGPNTFSPMLEKIYALQDYEVRECFTNNPWRLGNEEELVDTMLRRRERLETAVHSYCNKTKKFFPNWQSTEAVSLDYYSYVRVV